MKSVYTRIGTGAEKESAYLSLGHELPLVGEVVAGVLPDDALAPEDGADAAVADAHRHDRHDVRQDKVHDVVAAMEQRSR